MGILLCIEINYKRLEKYSYIAFMLTFISFLLTIKISIKVCILIQIYGMQYFSKKLIKGPYDHIKICRIIIYITYQKLHSKSYLNCEIYYFYQIQGGEKIDKKQNH